MAPRLWLVVVLEPLVVGGVHLVRSRRVSPVRITPLSGVNGTGAILVEVMTETGRQRLLPADVFGRAYGLAIPASIGCIVVGSLIAPALVSVAGLSGALVISGAVAVGYGLQLLAGQRPTAPVAPAGVA
jgi:hypothetical protein